MADPTIVQCPADVWTLVTSNVTAGRIHKLDSRPNSYLQTYRMTGNPAPVNVEEGAVTMVIENSDTIESAAPIDVYIMARGRDGRVRVDV